MTSEVVKAENLLVKGIIFCYFSCIGTTTGFIIVIRSEEGNGLAWSGLLHPSLVFDPGQHAQNKPMKKTASFPKLSHFYCAIQPQKLLPLVVS